MPSFNIKGESSINTSFGGCLSILILILTLAFAAVKFVGFYHKENPTITAQTVFDAVHQIDIKDSKTAIAFKLEGFFDKERKDDKRYIRNFVYLAVAHQNGT